MADYSIELGVKLNTKNIDTQISSYNRSKNLIKIKADLDPSDITKVLNSYKAKPINVDTKLNTDGITNAIRAYKPPKKIHLESELSTVGIDNKIKGYVTKKAINVDVSLNTKSINQQIQSTKPSEQIKIKAKLDNNAIAEAINSYKASKPILIKVQPDFRDINFNKVEETLKGYTTRTPLKVNVQLNKTAINNEISRFNGELKSDRNRDILLQVKITDAAISEALSKYNANGGANKSKIPIDLTISPNSEFDAKLKQKIAAYEKTPISIPAKLIPYDKGFSSQIQKVPIPIDVKLKNPAALNDAIKAYTGKEVPINATLVPSKNFDSAITNKKVRVHATIIPDEINQAIDYFTPKSKVRVGVQLNPVDVNAEISRLQKPTQPLLVDVALNQSSINNAISALKPNIPVMVNVALQTTDINAQIEAMRPTSMLKVQLDLNNAVAEAKTANQNIQAPIKVKVKLDREDLNRQVREFKTNTKIKVGVKLDFASHDSGQVGVPQQIKNYKTNTKIKVGVQIDRDSVNQALQGVTTTSPIPIKIKLEPNSVQNIQNQINNIRQQITALGNIRINFGGNSHNQSIGATTSALERAEREVHNLYKQIENMELKLGSLGMSGINSGNIIQYRTELDTLRTTYQTLLNTLRQGGTINLDSMFASIDHAKTSVTQLSSSIDNARTKLAKDIKLNIDNGTLQNQINSVTQSFNNLGVTNQQISNDILELQRLLGNMDASDDVESISTDYQNFLQILKTVKNSVNDLRISMAEANRPEILNAKKEAAMQKLNGLFEEGSKASKVFGQRAEDLRRELNQVGNVKGVDIVNQKIKNLETEIKNANLQTKTFSSTLKDQFRKYSSYFSVYTVFMYAIRAARSMFEQVKLIDYAMTELKKVTNETSSTYDKFLDNAASKAKKIGTTIDGLVASTADFARLGYGFEDAQGLAEVANIYAVVGDEVEGVEGATESLISTMAAFKDEAVNVSNTDFATSIIDKFNEIGNNFAISSGGIGEAMKRSASSLDAANNSIDESIALITAANTVVQNPEKVGRLLPTIKMAISVKLQRWTRPRKDFISIFDIRQLGRAYIFLCIF